MGCSIVCRSIHALILQLLLCRIVDAIIVRKVTECVIVSLSRASHVYSFLQLRLLPMNRKCMFVWICCVFMFQTPTGARVCGPRSTQGGLCCSNGRAFKLVSVF